MAPVSHIGLSKYTWMPFGLKSAPATFQLAIDVILASKKRQHFNLGIDNNIIFGKTKKKHLKYIIVVLLLFKNAVMTINTAMCFFFSTTLD